MTNQPRDSDGKFVQVDTDAIQTLNDEKTIGVCNDEHVTPAVEYTNVKVSLLKEAIKKAQAMDDMVRIGVMNKTGERDGREFEKGMVLLKTTPYSDEVITLAGLTREWDKE